MFHGIFPTRQWGATRSPMATVVLSSPCHDGPVICCDNMRLDAVSALVATLGLAGSTAGMPKLDHVAGAAIGLMIMRMGCITVWSALKQLSVSPLAKSAAGQAVE